MKPNKNYTKAILLLLTLLLGCSMANGYFIGLKSFDNTISNISTIQKDYGLNLPIVGFIFDSWGGDIKYVVNNFVSSLGTNKIYHITLSPAQYSAKDVAEGKYDSEYKDFFQTIKDNDLKVIFRTMHEMNGGWYPRGSNPTYFKKAWMHVWDISREVGLDQTNILFDMSVNHWDMPTTAAIPSQSAPLITCNKSKKYKTVTYQTFVKTGYKTETVTKKVAKPQTALEKKMNRPVVYETVTETKTVEYPIYKTTTERVQNCYTFEDYYPGDKYVDIMGVTFYNWGKATYSRQWYSPDRILNDSSRDTLSRLKSYNKPIFIDEVGTTAVWYTGAYSFEQSQISYQNDYHNKNVWLLALKDFLIGNPSIFGALYFNVDYTNGMQNWVGGEADWAVININNGKLYEGIFDLYENQESYDKLFRLFKEEGNQESVSTFNTTQFSDQQIIDLADLMISKFGKDESLRRVRDIAKHTDNSNLKALLNALQYVFESK